MREPPTDLLDLRAYVAGSVGWYHRGRRITEDVRAGLSETARGETRWSADPQLLDRLKAAEAAFTATFRP